MGKTFFFALAMSAVLAAAPASALVIDDFSTAGSVLVSGGGSDSDANTGGGILGSERELMLSSPGVGIASAEAIIAPPGTLEFDNESLTSGTLMLTYDGIGSGGLGGIDLTADGANRFAIVVLDSDIGITYMIDVTSASGTSTFGGAIPDLVSRSGPFPPFVPAPVPADALFADFVGTADFTEVTGIKFTFFGDENDLTIDLIGTVGEVPLPASALLLLSGLAGVGLVARRRR